MTENRDWVEGCNTYTTEDESLYVIVEYGKIIAMYEGEKMYPVNDDNIHDLAVKYNDSYDYYDGYTDTHILLDALEQHGCEDCPEKDGCEVYQENHSEKEVKVLYVFENNYEIETSTELETLQKSYNRQFNQLTAYEKGKLDYFRLYKVELPDCVNEKNVGNFMDYCVEMIQEYK